MQLKPFFALAVLLLSVYSYGCADNTGTGETDLRDTTKKNAPVETKKANTNYKPAFPGQTRIASVKTNKGFNCIANLFDDEV